MNKLSKHYANIKALDHVDLFLETGKLASIQGPSGCGKTTLLLCAGGLLKPSSGTVQINDTDIYSLNQNQRAAFRAQHIGFVFQQFHLIPYLTARQNILAAGLANKTANNEQRADELLNACGLSNRASHKPDALSAGQCQRIAFARAIFHKPSLLLADEPTGNLDPEASEIILNLIKDYATEHAVLIASHSKRVEKFSDCNFKISNAQIRTLD